MNLNNILRAMSSLYGANLNDDAIMMLKLDLKNYPEEKIIKALQKCRMELRFFPRLADILDRMEGSHLGENEAWALCPKTEEESVCWTPQIKKAYFVALPLLENGDKFGAMKAFCEVYRKEISEAKANQIEPVWEISLGFDKSQRETCLLEAVKLKRLEVEEIKQYLPYQYETQNILPLIEKLSEEKSLVKKIEGVL